MSPSINANLTRLGTAWCGLILFFGAPAGQAQTISVQPTEAYISADSFGAPLRLDCALVKAASSPAELQNAAELLVQDLDSASYQQRSRATGKLIGLGIHSVVPTIEHLANTPTGEVRFRLHQIIDQLAEDIQWPRSDGEAQQENEASTVSSLTRLEQQLLELAKSEQQAVARSAAKLLGEKIPAETSRLIQQLVAAARQEETVTITEDQLKNLADTPGLDLRRGAANKSTHWQQLADSTQHPEILMYRIRWFNGSWSNWFVPGVNDSNDSSPGKRHWNFFFDHEYEVLTVDAKRGLIRTRTDLLDSD